MLEVQSQPLKRYRFIDLFAGIGGFRLALESLGANCVYSSEWDPHAQKVYQANFGELPAGDITQIKEEEIPSHDILCAGFPCQAFSISGKRQGFEDSRGTLFFDIARIVKAKKPRVVLMENVKNFATHDEGRTLKVVQTTMKELGYTFFQKVLNAADHGIPQKRERIYMVCFQKSLDIQNFSFPQPVPLTRYVEDYLLKDPELTQNLFIQRADTFLNGKKDDTYHPKPIRLGMVNKGGQGEHIYSTKGVAITLSAYGGGVFSKTGGYLIDGKTRKLHPRECARLMGFPDSYQLDPNPTQAYKQLGNSVVVDLIQKLAIEIAHTLT